ncbi:hypothetical protein MMC09_006300 [Bachmanniomyces sp. S44760]|nr:hypothetical protein [Bachmanniomyces sp. S44760]
MQDVFSREPPVVAKEEGTAIHQKAPQTNGGAPPIPLLPRELGSSDSNNTHTTPQSIGQNRPPQPPPKPFNSHVRAASQSNEWTPPVPPHPSTSDNRYSSTNGTTAVSNYQTVNLSGSMDRYRSPPLDPHRQHQGQGGPLPAAYESNSRTNYQNTTQGEPPQAQYLHNQPSFPSQATGRIRSFPAYQQQHPPPSSEPSYPSQRQFQAQYQQHHPPTTNQPRLQPPPPPPPPAPADLLTSPFDTPLPTSASTQFIPAPPIPPNPEKDALLSAISQTLTQHIHSNLNSNASAIPALQAQQSALLSTLGNLNTERQSLTQLQNLLTSNKQILHKAMADADAVIADVNSSNNTSTSTNPNDAKARAQGGGGLGEGRGSKHSIPPPDAILVAPTVVGQQIYELVAEERACVEGRAVLGRALDKGRVGCESWTKGVRGLAREEFLKKALIRKAAGGMGLILDVDVDEGVGIGIGNEGGRE